MLCSAQSRNECEMEQSTVGQRCTLVAFGKAFIFVAHQVISETRTCQSSMLPCLNMTYFGRQTKMHMKRTKNVGKITKNVQNTQFFT